MPTVVGQTSALLGVPIKPPFTCKFLLAMTGFSPAPGSINRNKEERGGWMEWEGNKGSDPFVLWGDTTQKVL